MHTYEYQRSRSLFDLCLRSLGFILSSIFCCKASKHIEAKFHVERLWVVRMKVCYTSLYSFCLFSNNMCLCVNVCLFFFSSKISQELLNTNVLVCLDVFCKRKSASSCLSIIPYIRPFFFLSNKNFCHRFLSSYESHSLQILYTPWEWPSILWEREPRCWELFLPPFPFFYHSNIICRENCVKDFSGTTVPRILKVDTNVRNDLLYCVKENQPSHACHSLHLSIFLSLQ